MAAYTSIENAPTSYLGSASLKLSYLRDVDDLKVSKNAISFNENESGFVDIFHSWRFTGKFEFEESASGEITALSGLVSGIEESYEEYDYDEAETLFGYSWSFKGGAITVADLQTLDAAALPAKALRGDDTLLGSAEDDTLSGYAGADRFDGREGRDTASYAASATGLSVYLGDAGQNTGDAKGDTFESIENLKGSTFADTLAGDKLGNRLDGNGGKDRITGGAGRDTFDFTAEASAANAVTITDFSHKDDRFALDAGVFSKLMPGKLAEDAFHLGTKAADREDRIVYDKKHGKLYFDQDGSKDGFERIKFAEVKDRTFLDHTDFLVI